MKSISLILLILLLCVNFYAQDKTESTDTKSKFEIGHDDCGDPAVESQTYAYRQGKVTKIIASNKILFEQNSAFGHEDKGTFTVILVGIDANQNKKNIENFLKKNVLNQSVQIIGNTQKDNDKTFGGVLTLFNDNNEDIDELSEYLLENGIAKFKFFYSANLVPYDTPCILEKAEKRAKEAKLGIWGK